jgi:hypothetical protein
MPTWPAGSVSACAAHRPSGLASQSGHETGGRASWYLMASRRACMIVRRQPLSEAGARLPACSAASRDSSPAVWPPSRSAVQPQGSHAAYMLSA